MPRDPAPRSPLPSGPAVDVELHRALLHAAARLDALAVERARLARQSRAGWVGALRSRFDAERATRDAAAADLAARCRALAARIAIGPAR